MQMWGKKTPSIFLVLECTEVSLIGLRKGRVVDLSAEKEGYHIVSVMARVREMDIKRWSTKLRPRAKNSPKETKESEATSLVNSFHYLEKDVQLFTRQRSFAQIIRHLLKESTHANQKIWEAKLTRGCLMVLECFFTWTPPCLDNPPEEAWPLGTREVCLIKAQSNSGWSSGTSRHCWKALAANITW